VTNSDRESPQSHVELDDGTTYVGTYELRDGAVIFTGRLRRRANGTVLYSEPATWIWPVRRLQTIKTPANVREVE
jgi:hypothetical protein